MDMTPEFLAKARRFREMHLRPEILVLPNPWDKGTTRLLEHLGFEAVATTSAGFAHSQGMPDGAVTRDAALDHAAEIASVTGLPVSADLENCYSDEPGGVASTVAAATDTGIVGGSIEDASGDADSPIYEFGLAVDRVVAAVEAARRAAFPSRSRRELKDFSTERSTWITSSQGCRHLRQQVPMLCMPPASTTSIRCGRLSKPSRSR